MAMFELTEVTSDRPAAPNPLDVFNRMLRAARQWQLRRQTAAQLARLPEHLRRDAGFEPVDIFDPLDRGAPSLWRKADLELDLH